MTDPVSPDAYPATLLVCGYPPNTTDGGGIILRNLFAGFPPERLAVVATDFRLEELSKRGEAAGLLPATEVPMRPLLSSSALARMALSTLNAARIPSMTRRIADLARTREVIVAVPWGNVLGSEIFVAAYLAHRETGTPLVVYELDEWRASINPFYSGLLARVLERRYHGRAVEEAASVWVVSEPMAEEFRDRFGIDARVLPNCVYVDEVSRGRTGERVAREVFRLLFTGAVYGPQAGAIASVLGAIENFDELPTELVIYTSQIRRNLALFGVSGSRLRIERPVPLSAIPDVLGTADALLLPFSFDASQRAIVSTSLPTKTADYLASGVPILVHAPPYASITRLARHEGWAAVVDEPDPSAVRSALDRLARDGQMRKELVAKAFEAARARHDLRVRRAEFLESLRTARASRRAQ